MDAYSGVLWIAGALLLVLLAGLFRSKIEWMINFVLRGVMGMLAIYFANYFLAQQIAGIGIGYNALSFLTAGLLGFPGIVMLYGINLYMIL